MMRLTNHDDQGNWSLKGVKWENLYEGAVIDEVTYEKLYTALWRLKEYEDTGLDPDRIEELKERDTEYFCKTSIFDHDSVVCRCGNDIEKDSGFNFCPYCGIRIKLED